MQEAREVGSTAAGWRGRGRVSRSSLQGSKVSHSKGGRGLRWARVREREGAGAHSSWRVRRCFVARPALRSSTCPPHAPLTLSPAWPAHPSAPCPTDKHLGDAVLVEVIVVEQGRRLALVRDSQRIEDPQRRVYPGALPYPAAHAHGRTKSFHPKVLRTFWEFRHPALLFVYHSEDFPDI